MGAKGVINVIAASYGRQHGNEVCPHSAVGNQDCHAVKSLPKVKQFCEGKSSCNVQSTNTHFGDPCGGTYKYLTVKYVCKDPCATNNGGCHSARKCMVHGTAGKVKCGDCPKGWDNDGAKGCK